MCNGKINKSRLVLQNVAAAATEDYVKRSAVSISNKLSQSNEENKPQRGCLNPIRQFIRNLKHLDLTGN